MVHGTTLRNNQASQFSSLIDGGGGAGKIELRTGSTIGSGTLLSTITLNSTSFGSPSTGVITAAGFPKTDSSAAASGTIGHYVIKDNAGTQVGGGTSVGAGSGECNMVTLSVVATQPVTMNSFTYTIPVGS